MESRFTDQQARDAWNKGARAYETFVEAGADYYRRVVHGPALLAACGPVTDKTTLDLGCGQGYFTRALARAGARVCGVELADELVGYARAHEAKEPLGVEYRVLSAAAIDQHWSANSIDLVTSCMALQDMAAVDTTLQSAFAVLRGDGRMVFSVPHPCTDTPVREWERATRLDRGALKIDRYFDTGPAVCRWTMSRLLYAWDTPCWRHTIAEWSELVANAGFLIHRLHEPRPTEAQVRQNPKLSDCSRLPYFLILDLVKPQR